MEESNVLVDCGSGVGADAVEVRWDAAPPVIDPAAAAHIDQRWRDYVADARTHGKTLFDGPITRLIAAEGVIRRGSPYVSLQLGLGSYKAFVVTRLRDREWFAANGPEAMTLALGNSVLLTHGGKALLGIRSQRVSCYAGRAHLIGGVVEALGTEKFPATVEGLIAHLMLELHEEAGVTAENLLPRGQWPRLLGVFNDRVLGQPEAIWRWETRTPLEEIGRRFDRSEHDGSIVVSPASMTDELNANLTPVARHAMRVWQL